MTPYELHAMRLALNGEDGGLVAFLNGRRVVDFAAAKRRLRPAPAADQALVIGVTPNPSS